MEVLATKTSEGHRARLYWQCRRGMLELDWMLKRFLDVHYEALSNRKMTTFENLLSYPDAVLLEWFMGRIAPFDKDIAYLVESIRDTTAN